MELYNNYLSNSISIDSNKYNHLYNQFDKLNTPYYNTNNDDNFTHKLNNLILGIINNYDEFDTDTINNDTITRNKFIFQQYIEKEQISID